jgi:hypothetical protein
MTNTILLTNNNETLNLIAYFLDNLTPLQTLTNTYYVTRILDLSSIDNIEICSGLVKLKNKYIDYNPEFSKTENTNYSSAIITDHTFVNNILYFLPDFNIPILDTNVIVGSVKYFCNKSIQINEKYYYVLEQI